MPVSFVVQHCDFWSQLGVTTMLASVTDHNVAVILVVQTLLPKATTVRKA